MNFLELCQMTRELAGIKGTGPTTVVSQAGEMLRVVNWVKKSWIDIQNLHPTWNFLRADLSFPTIAGTGDYTLAQMNAPRLKLLDRESLRCNQTLIGTPNLTFMEPWDYDAFRNTYRFVARPQGRPVRFTQDIKTKGLMLAAIPDAAPDGGGFTITGIYWTQPVDLTADTDIPAMPDEFHMLIPYWALSKYAGYEAAPEAKEEAVENKNRLLAALESDQLPPMFVGH